MSEREGTIVWRRVSRGMLFILFGIFFFLSSQGLLHRGFWIDALAFWPVILVAIGLRMIFERSIAPWAVLVSPVVVGAALGFVAWRGPDGALARWGPVSGERPDGVETWTLEAHMGLADLDVRTRPLAQGLLVQGRSAPADRGTVRVADRGTYARATLRGHRRHRGIVIVMPGRRQRWDVDVAEDLPMKVQLETAFAEGELDLASAEVTRFDLDGAFNALTLRLGAPREDVRIDVEGAFNHLEIIVPDETPVRYTTDGFINLVDGRKGARSGPGYRLRSDGAFNRVVIRSADDL